MSKHSKFSASASHRWVRCAGSVAAEEGLLDVPSPYAKEGSGAHDCAQYRLREYPTGVVLDICFGGDYETYANRYVSYIYDDIMNYNADDYDIHIEQKVDYSHIAPDGFGTADCIVWNKKKSVLHIIDYKYGRGVKEHAKDNTQLLLYAMGAINTFKIEPESIVLHIFQPRVNNVNHWQLDRIRLANAENYIKEKVEDALQPNARRIPSDIACRWCKFQDHCPENLANHIRYNNLHY